MSVKFRVTKKERLARKLHELAPEAQREVTKTALKSAREVAETAQTFVPVRTGALRDSGRVA